MIEILFIRHGATKGNALKRYIGTTDESLSQEGAAKLKASGTFQGWEPDVLYVSPLKRCIETAQILYEGKEYTVISDLRECDFGDFENKNYKELASDERYQAWVDSNGRLPFPGGESSEEFKERSHQSFCSIVAKALVEGDQKIGIIAHGGTIMSILEKISEPCKEFYEWSLGNGEGYLVHIENGEKAKRIMKINSR
jgi:alpha-ribazole phosphatase